MIFRAPLLLLVALTLALAIACDSDDGDSDKTPVASPSAAATPGGTAATGVTPSGDIRALDVGAAAAVVALIADTGGQFTQADVLYADLTDDGIEEAIVPVASGGTQGYLGFAVLTPAGAGTTTLLTEQPSDSGMQIAIEDETLVMIEPVPAPDDPFCCPSMLRRTTYAWNGAALAVDDVETIPNPQGGVKTPSTSP